ncbi:hypothetical protein J2X20_002983 [Pelomonas saccharophila]|uniref:DUF4166 domain-containing protein n=1 Tax=Roseateles saccharophilus TaxID=304 RepID=A0ABU1YN95_ROSSA|nr:DUF4166 domain-containing protein [Roseateles saccharophilus]MDR7270325.1 hypothetical protein [Roseateles saccharophilus]
MNAAQPLDLSALIGPAAWARLPAAVQRRFAAGHAEATYHGLMDMRCSRLGRVLAWLVKPLRSPLAAANASGVPTTVRVRAVGAGVVWERSFENGVGRVFSTKELDAGGRLQERTRGGLGMALNVFEHDGALVFQSHRYFLDLGGLRLVMPRLLSPGTCRVEHRDLGDGLFRFTLSMDHPVWGETFHQTGVFVDPSPDLAG